MKTTTVEEEAISSLDEMAFALSDAEWEVLGLLYEALDGTSRLSLSYEELTFLTSELTVEELREAVDALAAPGAKGRPSWEPLTRLVPNLMHLPIYRITPTGRDLVELYRDALRHWRKQ